MTHLSTVPTSGEHPPTPWGPVTIDLDAGPASEMTERIVDAAHALFADNGVRGTTMSQLAAEVGISRMWLYRHFPNRDAIASAVFAREARRFVQGLLDRDDPAGDPIELGIDAFVYAVDFLRRHELLQSLLATEAEAVLPILTGRIGPYLHLATATVALFIRDRLGLAEAQARVSAETIVRLVVSITLTTEGASDFDDEAQLRAFAAVLFPRLLAR